MRHTKLILQAITTNTSQPFSSRGKKINSTFLFVVCYIPCRTLPTRTAAKLLLLQLPATYKPAKVCSYDRTVLRIVPHGETSYTSLDAGSTHAHARTHAFLPAVRAVTLHLHTASVAKTALNGNAP